MLAALILMTLSAPTVQAAEPPIDLVMGEQGSLPWSIGNIRPGDRGSETVVLSNMGSVTAYLRVWVSGIQPIDGGGDGAALAKYMRFALAADGLTTTMRLPAAIDEFPASPTDRGQLVIGPIASGGSATLHWNWEFVETGAPQNDAQGDGLRFDISYMLTDAPPPAAAYKYLAVDIMGWQSVVEADSTGLVQHNVDAVDPLGTHHLVLAAGTRIIDQEGNVPGRIVLSAAGRVSQTAPPGTVPVSPAYLLQGYLADGSGVDLTFSLPATIVIGINATSVPAGYLPMGVHLLTDDGWSRLPAAGNLSRWSAIGMIDRTGILAVHAALVQADSSVLHVTDLAVSPEVRENGWPITISSTVGRSATVTASVANLGNSSGIFRVDLLVDGAVRDSVTVVFEPGEVVTLILRADGLEDGEHTAEVLDRSSRFRSGTSVDWALIIISNAAAFSSLLIVRQRHIVQRPARSGGRSGRADLTHDLAHEEPANPLFVDSIGEVWEARRTAEEIVKGDAHDRRGQR